MVLSDLILGWSQLVTGHADSSIISYLKMLHVRFSLWCVAVKWVMTAHFNSEGSPWQTSSPKRRTCSVHRGWFRDQFPMGKPDRYPDSCNEEGKVPAATRHRGYGMYCKWSLSQFISDALRENPTCVTFTILDICRSVQQVFFFSYQCKSTPLQVWKDKKSHVNLLPPRFLPTLWPNLMA